MFKKQDGYYWVKQNDGSKIGYPSLVSLIGERVGFALIAYVAVLVVSVVIVVISL